VTLNVDFKVTEMPSTNCVRSCGRLSWSAGLLTAGLWWRFATEVDGSDAWHRAESDCRKSSLTWLRKAFQ